jgi:signal transduction histidine kinase
MQDQPFTILIVDDNPNNLFTLRTLIEAHINAQIIEATSGKAALQTLMAQRVDLIILDVQMPELDGFETAALIRQRKKMQHIPIVFLTAAYKTEEFRQRGFEVGAADYLTKPIDDFQLISRIKSYLRFIIQERQHNQELEHKVEQRTAELLQANARLQQEIKEREQAQAELWQSQQTEALQRAKAEFLANISHELRTPLNAVLGYAQILERDNNLTAQQQESVAIIRRSGMHLLTLIDDILELSRLEAQRLELYRYHFRLPASLKKIVDLFSIRAKQQRLSLTYEPLTRLPEVVHGDEVRLRQVLMNLLGNAFQFTPKGGVQFKASYAGGKMRFEIEDTGVGIAPKHLAHLYDSFQKVGKQTEPKQGVGLGLAISKRLVEMMGGELHVQSTQGKGSTFWFEVPLPKVEGVLPQATETAENQIIRGFHGEPRTVLVIDDKWENRAVLNDLLTPLGFTVIEAENGQIGLEKALASQPDVILTDLVMPTLDGFELIKRLRQLPQLEAVVIIAVSASVPEHELPGNSQVGYNAFLAKPISLEKLLYLLQTYLQLAWIYEEEAENIDTTPPQTDELPTLEVGPSSEVARLIYDLGMRGDIGGIREQADQLEQAEPELAPFAKELRRLAKSYQDDKICQLVEAYM